MRIITSHPIIRYSSSGELSSIMEEFASIDGQNDVQVRNFQIFANKKGANIKVNGKWNRPTRSAYAVHGAAWEKQFAKDFPNYSPTGPDGKKRSGHFWDKVKNAWVVASELGLVDRGMNALNLQNNQEPAPVGQFYTPEPMPEKKSSNKAIFIVLGVVVAAAVGYAIYKQSTK